MSVDNKFLVRDKITLKVTGLGSSGEGVGMMNKLCILLIVEKI